MATGDKKQRDLARRLARLSLGEDGTPSEERVAAILDSLRGKPPRGHRRILKLFLHYIRHEIARNQAVIEHAGPIGDDTVQVIEKDLSEKYGRRITSVTKENPDLIAGVRVHIADDVYDASIKGKLEAIRNASA